MNTIWNILKGFFLGLLFFIVASYLWYLFETSHVKTMRVKDCERSAGQSLKALSAYVEGRWFERKHYDIEVFSDGPCMFFQYYEKPGTLYFGQATSSGHFVAVAMTSRELHQLADSIPADFGFEQMSNYLFQRAKTKPAPMHEL
ncbi:hypothetical protein Dfer_1682 [Dyadobacter fermentans DSM 18053]|uniref:Uncharacterized protein n=2 Tax=Dyadobacter fermentans TaxID=94254 RepID=C6VTI1_DYAFD|nr:hypothetical protein Dfer_1682 [Dyadobacter fermentans DSM 18053]